MAKKIVEDMAKEYVANHVPSDVNHTIKQVVHNIYLWASSGKNQSEIAKYLNLSKKEFDEMLRKYPETLGAFAKGKEFANTLLSMSMFEMAVGKGTTRRQILNRDGEPVWLEEEIPPNVRFNALKFLLESQVPQTYGKQIAKADENDYAKAFANMTDEEKQALMLIEKKETIKTLQMTPKYGQKVVNDE
jgi:hypothetical protein